MPKKYVYDSETLQILESLWAQGMQNCSTDENKLKIQQASTATGLVDERIKLWIYCRNRKKRRDVEGKSKKAKSSSTTAATIPSDDVTRNNLKEINQTVVNKEELPTSKKVVSKRSKSSSL
ncbi:hypothetical protein Q5P01_001407 [Channa striata]|uniref:Uncharacterized protein n=1 Tax=Channa striata TaxID=64152 RepID=A0AA88T730_CHASR|nr:hypothetical protein Q5P01_001407 [Channa striata]